MNRLSGELVPGVAFAEFPDVLPEVILIVEMIEVDRRHAIVADRRERDQPSASGIRKMVAERAIERFGLRVVVCANESVEDLPTGQRPVLAIFVEHGTGGFEEQARLALRPVIGEVSASATSFTASRNFSSHGRNPAGAPVNVRWSSPYSP